MGCARCEINAESLPPGCAFVVYMRRKSSEEAIARQDEVRKSRPDLAAMEVKFAGTWRLIFFSYLHTLRAARGYYVHL